MQKFLVGILHVYELIDVKVTHLHQLLTTMKTSSNAR
jgi:hypothetical protein